MPWERSVASLGRLVKYSILLWSTDAVDGKIARFRFGGDRCGSGGSKCVHGRGDGHERADVRFSQSRGGTGAEVEERCGALPLVRGRTAAPPYLQQQSSLRYPPGALFAL